MSLAAFDVPTASLGVVESLGPLRSNRHPASPERVRSDDVRYKPPPAVDFKLSLQSETIRSAYPETPVAVEPDTPIEDVIRLMQAERVAAVLICDDDQLVGVFTERDVLRLLSKQADLSQAITTVMTRGPSTVTDSATVGDAISLMAEGGYRHLPLVSAIRPSEATGMIDVRGVMHYLVEHFPSTIYNLPPQSTRATAEREGA